MNVIVGRPPAVYDLICEKIGMPPATAIFTYAPDVYSPGGTHLVTPDLEVHENVHMAEQLEMTAKKWWARYLDDPQFRLEAEMRAYRAQYAHAKRLVKDRNRLARYRVGLAFSMAGAIYGRVMTFDAAYREIGR